MAPLVVHHDRRAAVDVSALCAVPYRVAQLLKVERVRTRIAIDLHDDIGASLSRMAILSEVVKQQTGTNGEQSAGLLTEIAESAADWSIQGAI